MEELREMNYLQAAISESLRLYPSVPLVPRSWEEELPDGVGADVQRVCHGITPSTKGGKGSCPRCTARGPPSANIIRDILVSRTLVRLVDPSSSRRRSQSCYDCTRRCRWCQGAIRRRRSCRTGWVLMYNDICRGITPSTKGGKGSCSRCTTRGPPSANMIRDILVNRTLVRLVGAQGIVRFGYTHMILPFMETESSKRHF
ncbi:hypothetical protein BHE74_00004115 [Ensete ventricosum]|nr:hypothetical protein BHE74_00004115 [Ensete ventricosum]